LGIFTTAILNRLGYGGKEAALPDEKDSNAEWKLADAWVAQPKVKLFKVLTQRLRVSAIRKKL